jgi:hypothetical protein
VQIARMLFLILALILAMAGAGMAPAAAVTRTQADPFVAEVLKLTNQYRADNGLPPVVWNQQIGNISQQWAEEQNRRITGDTFTMETIHREGYGSQQLPVGWDWYTENIGINNNARQVVDWWMDSPVHRKGMLSPYATDIGIGWMKTTDPDYYGMYVVVENLAGYASTRATLPEVDLSSVHEGDIAAVDGSGYLYVYPSAGGGDLWDRTYLSAGWEDAVQIEVADWNSDGVQDIVAKRKNGTLVVSYGQESGGLAAPRTVGSTSWLGLDIEVTRWKRSDQYPGILARSLADGKLYYYPNTNGSSYGARSQVGTGFKGLSTLTLDYDVDGKMDLIARTKTGTGQLKLYRSNGSGKFISETRKVIRTSGWNKMTHLSSISGHLGSGSNGILAMEKSGNLRYFPVTRNKVGSGITIGRGGWETLRLGS